MSDLISRQTAICALEEVRALVFAFGYHNVIDTIRELPSAPPETCEGCGHLGKWENEVELGYPSPCTSCKRMREDHYERGDNCATEVCNP